MKKLLISIIASAMLVSPAWGVTAYKGELPPFPPNTVFLTERAGNCPTLVRSFYFRLYDTDGDPRSGAEIADFGVYNIATDEYGPPQVRIIYGPGSGGQFARAFVKIGGGVIKRYDGLEGRVELSREYPTACDAVYADTRFDA